MVSLPCTGGCAWQHMNMKYASKRPAIEEQRKLFFELLTEAVKVCQTATDNGGWITFELPASNIYWNSEAVQQFCADFRLKFAELDGCAFGLKSMKGLPIKKPWPFATICPAAHQNLHKEVCCGGHIHEMAQVKRQTCPAITRKHWLRQSTTDTRGN